MSASCTSRVRFRRDDHHRGPVGRERADLGDGHGIVGQDLEQEGLELVVGPVDLVDEQNRQRPVVVRDRLEEGTANEEALVVQLVLQPGRGVGRGEPGRLGRAQMEELAGVVPLVHGLGHIDALVALEPDQGTADPVGENPRDLGLADPGLTLQQERSGQVEGEEDGSGEALVGQVRVVTKRFGDLVDINDGTGIDDRHPGQVTDLGRRGLHPALPRGHSSTM